MLVTPKLFDRALAYLMPESRLIVDTETTGVNPWTGDRVCGVSITTPSLKRDFYFPIRHRPGGNLPDRQCNALFDELSQPRTYTGWNIKFDFEMLLQDGVPLPDRWEDVMLACHHLNENDTPMKLKRWAKKYIDPEADGEEAELIKMIRARLKELKMTLGGKEPIAYISYLNPAQTEPYACDDVYYTERLRQMAIPELKKWQTLTCWHNSNVYLRDTADMEVRGMLFDVRQARINQKEAIAEVRKARAIIQESAGYTINLSSPKQVNAWLGVTSSAEAVLDQMTAPEAKVLASYRKWLKADNTYYTPLLNIRDSDDVVHPNLLLHGTVTGRQSARNPPLHGTPKDKETRREYRVKECFVARSGYVYVSADYSQMELRMGVSVAKEENMAKLFLSGEDIHQAVADALHIDRDPAKTINFMILYGGGEEKLSRMLNIPLRRAREYLRRYHQEYWHFRHTSKFWSIRARYQGYVRLWSGRVRHFNSPRANPKDALNALVQGGCAEMLRDSVSRMAPILPAWDAHILLQIHDQAIVECPTELVHPVAKIMRQEMEAFDQFLIPPKVDIKVGTGWGTLKDIKEWDKVA